MAAAYGRHPLLTSDHEALSSLVHAFFECESPSGEDAAEFDGDEFDPDGGSQPEHTAAAVRDLIRGMTKDDAFRVRLLSDAARVAEALAALRPSASGYRRSVMARLRAMGYDAAICKAGWEKSGGVMAGGHEYIDVVVDAERRYIVDLGFAAEFAVARATPEYEKVVAALPELMVASLDEVRQAVQMVGKAARRSLEARALHVPPWRTGRYMMAKWLGPYRRIVNAVPSSAGVPVVGGGEGNCRGLRFAAARAALASISIRNT